MHLRTDNIVSYETFQLFQTRKRTRELIDGATKDIIAARQALADTLIAAGWPAANLPPPLPPPVMIKAWWVGDNGHPT